MTPPHSTLPPPASDARRSKAQSGSLKATLLLAPAPGAAANCFQSEVPVRRIDRAAMPASVPLTTVKLPASARAGEAVAARITAAAKIDPLLMAPIYAENRAEPRG